MTLDEKVFEETQFVDELGMRPPGTWTSYGGDLLTTMMSVIYAFKSYVYRSCLRLWIMKHCFPLCCRCSHVKEVVVGAPKIVSRFESPFANDHNTMLWITICKLLLWLMPKPPNGTYEFAPLSSTLRRCDHVNIGNPRFWSLGGASLIMQMQAHYCGCAPSCLNSRCPKSCTLSK